MSKLKVRLIIASLAFLLGVAGTTWYFNTQKLRLFIPNHRWVQMDFKYIDPVAMLSGQTDLKKILPKDDIEVRIWKGFGLSPLRGVTLKRVSGQWSAIYIKDSYDTPRKVKQKELYLPKSGWDTCWKQLVDAGILTLPDASEINCNILALDGISYIIETNTDRTYRTYLYANPMLSKCNEAKQMIKIFEIVDKEFELND